jgi:hypothetical protein
MIADLIDDKLKIRLITRNVMAVYSTNSEYTDNFIRRIKHSSYVVNKEKVASDSIISYIKKTYNIYENIYRYVKRHRDVSLEKFIDYISFLDLNHLLWTHFYQLSKNDLRLIELLIQLSSNRKIVVTDYIDDFKDSSKLYSLLFHVGLEDRLIIVPFKNITDAVNNSTCQCYVKNDTAAKIQQTFSNEFINTEFKTSLVYYSNKRPKIYSHNNALIAPTSYRYSLYELFAIILFFVKMLFISFYNWRMRVT